MDESEDFEENVEILWLSKEEMLQDSVEVIETTSTTHEEPCCFDNPEVFPEEKKVAPEVEIVPVVGLVDAALDELCHFHVDLFADEVLLSGEDVNLDLEITQESAAINPMSNVRAESGHFGDNLQADESNVVPEIKVNRRSSKAEPALEIETGCSVSDYPTDHSNTEQSDSAELECGKSALNTTFNVESDSEYLPEEEDCSDSGEKPQGKRKRNIQMWKSSQRKKLKETGNEYVASTGKTKRARTIGEVCSCKRLNCKENFSPDARGLILQEFLTLTSSGQNQFLVGHVDRYEKLRFTTAGPSRREYSIRYYLPCASGRVEVCKYMFLRTFDISAKKVRYLLDKQTGSERHVLSEDQRVHNQRRIVFTDESKALVRKHIEMFPAYTSHYTREKSSRKYLCSDLNVAKMFDLYVAWCGSQNVEPVTSYMYRKIFVEEFNLSFRKPKVDTCSRCDQLKVLINSTEDVESKAALEHERDDHQNWATQVYKQKDKDKGLAKKFPNVRTMSFDLQKVLPTPSLTSGVSYYNRQLYTLNLTTYTTGYDESSKATCYLWHEGIAKRGSQEIGSCLYKELQSLPSTVDTLICYSDSCRGQNANFFICCMFSYYIEQCQLAEREMTIVHRLLVPGHTHMEADVIHGAIEKAKKSSNINIEIPKDWAQMIANVRRKNPINVVELNTPDFLAFKLLEGMYYVRPKKNVNNEAIRFGQIVCFKYVTSDPGVIFFKYKLSSEYEKMIIKNDKLTPLPTLEPISTELLPLPQEKLQDLRDLQKFITPVNRVFYDAFLSHLQPKKKGRKPKITVSQDHFDADLSEHEHDG